MDKIVHIKEDRKSIVPEQKGFSSRNLKYMRKFAETWPDEQIVQRSVALLSWRHNICLMEKAKEPNRRLAYAIAAYNNGWSHNILELQLEAYTLEREGKLPNNFNITLPSWDSDMMQYLFKDPFLLDFTGADASSRVKYSLESVNKPVGVASWETELSQELKDKWKSALPSIEAIEAKLNEAQHDQD